MFSALFTHNTHPLQVTQSNSEQVMEARDSCHVVFWAESAE